MAAARRGDPEAAGELARLASDPLYPAIVRATALSLLERYPGAESEATLRNALFDEEPLMRHTAVTGLAVADPAERVALLAPLLFDAVKAVRMAAVSQLASTASCA